MKNNAEELYKALEEAEVYLRQAMAATSKVMGNAEVVKNFVKLKEDADTRDKRISLDKGIDEFSSLVVAEAEDVDELITRARTVIADGLAEPEAVEDHTLTEDELREMYKDKHTNIEVELVEEKQHILNLLLPAIRYTRAGEGVKALQDNGDGSMWILYKTGAAKKVNIECDSGIAMIADVCRALM